MDHPRHQPAEAPKIFRLRAVTARLSSILLDHTKKQFWVRAQLVAGKGVRKGGYFYGELADIDDDGQTVAKIGVVIWRAEFERIQKKLIDEGQSEVLAGNREVCVLCSVRFHEVHGLRLQIFDMDPNFGESHIDRNRHQILQKLEREGLLQRNKTIPVPVPSLRIGLITAAHSAAHADFTKTLSASPFAFQVVMAACTMQGRETSAAAVAAITTLVRARVDLICLVRGGGSPLDLASFDDEAIARAIAGCPVPVWTGIGHEIDMTVPDFVAHTSHKTPTAVAEALVKSVRTLDEDLALARGRLVESCGRRLELAQRAILSNWNGLQQGVRKHQEIGNQHFLGQVVRMQSALAAQVARQDASLGGQLVQTQERVRARIESAEMGVANRSQQFQDGLKRRMRRAEEVLGQNRIGLTEGTRKHLALHDERFQRWVATLQRKMDRVFGHWQESLTAKAVRLEGKLDSTLERQERRLAQYGRELLAALDRAVGAGTNLLALKTSRFSVGLCERILDRALENLEEKGKRLNALSPELLLARGYSLTRDAAGRIIRSAREVLPGQAIYTQLAEGALTSVVTETEKPADDGSGTAQHDL